MIFKEDIEFDKKINNYFEDNKLNLKNLFQQERTKGFLYAVATGSFLGLSVLMNLDLSSDAGLVLRNLSALGVGATGVFSLIEAISRGRKLKAEYKEIAESEVVEEIAESSDITPNEVKDEILIRAFSEFREGENSKEL